MAIKKGIYKVKNDQGQYDEIHLRTSTDQVVENENKRFVSNAEKATWNSKADGNHNHANYLARKSRLHASDSTSIDSFGYGASFDYNTAANKSGVTGPIIAFGGTDAYAGQLVASYNSTSTNSLRFRTKNGDTGNWNPWKSIFHEGHLPTAAQIGASPSNHTHANKLDFKKVKGSTVNIDNWGEEDLLFSNLGDGIGGVVPTGGNNAKSILHLNTHPGHNMQLCFDSTLNQLHIRSKSAAAWRGWETLYHTGNKPTPADIGAAASNHSHSNYLPLSGGTLTGNINYSGGGYKSYAIRFKNGDTSGAGMAIGAGGLTVVGSGESSDLVLDNNTATTENLYLASDQSVVLASNLQGGWANRKYIEMKPDGELYVGGGNKVYHQAFKPTPADIGAASTSHAQDFAGTTSSTYIAYPKDGRLKHSSSSVTGYLKITLPQAWSSTMIMFTVDIFNYKAASSVSYTVSGYNYSSGNWTNCSAFSHSHKDSDKKDLPVRFGYDGSKCAIYIGEANTVWGYPQATVKDITVGFGAYDLTKWNSGWKAEIVTTLGTITATVTSPHVSNHTHQTLTKGSYLTGANYNGSTATTWAVDADTNPTANKIVARDSAGDVKCRLIRSNYQNQATISGAIAFRTTNADSDNYVRFCDNKAAIRTYMEVYSKGETYSRTESDNKYMTKANTVFTDTISIKTPANALA